MLTTPAFVHAFQTKRVGSRPPAPNRGQEMKKRWRAISLLLVLGSIATLVATWNLPENGLPQRG